MFVGEWAQIVEGKGWRRGSECCSAHIYSMQGSVAVAKASR